MLWKSLFEAIKIPSRIHTQKLTFWTKTIDGLQDVFPFARDRFQLVYLGFRGVFTIPKFIKVSKVSLQVPIPSDSICCLSTTSASQKPENTGASNKDFKTFNAQWLDIVTLSIRVSSRRAPRKKACTLLKTNMFAPKNWCLEGTSSFSDGPFLKGELLIFFGRYQNLDPPSKSPSGGCHRSTFVQCWGLELKKKGLWKSRNGVPLKKKGRFFNRKIDLDQPLILKGFHL